MSLIMSGSDSPWASREFRGLPSSLLKISHTLQSVINTEYSVSWRQRDVTKIFILLIGETSQMRSLLSELFLGSQKKYKHFSFGGTNSLSLEQKPQSNNFAPYLKSSHINALYNTGFQRSFTVMNRKKINKWCLINELWNNFSFSCKAILQKKIL